MASAGHSRPPVASGLTVRLQAQKDSSEYEGDIETLARHIATHVRHSDVTGKRAPVVPITIVSPHGTKVDLYMNLAHGGGTEEHESLPSASLYIVGIGNDNGIWRFRDCEEYMPQRGIGTIPRDAHYTSSHSLPDITLHDLEQAVRTASEMNTERSDKVARLPREKFEDLDRLIVVVSEAVRSPKIRRAVNSVLCGEAPSISSTEYWDEIKGWEHKGGTVAKDQRSEPLSPESGASPSAADAPSEVRRSSRKGRTRSFR